MVHDVSQTAMEVTLTISMWGASKTDRELSNQAAADSGGDQRAFRVVKSLIPKGYLDPINKTARQLRKTFHKYTLPWLHDGTGLLPVTLYPKFAQEIAELQGQMEADVEALARNIESIKEAAEKSLGTAYEERDIPGEDQIKKLFGVSTKVRPIRTAGDFRVGLSADVIESIKADYDEEIKAQVGAGTASAYARVVEVLDSMISGLERHGSTPDGGGKPGYFKDAVIENVGELSDILDDLNVSKDPALTSLSSHLRTRLTVFSPNDLRDNHNLRASVVEDAKVIRENAKKASGIVDMLGL